MKRLPLRFFPTINLVWLTMLSSAWCTGYVSQTPPPISVAELGAKAGAQYQGDGLSVVATPEGARLRCVFQKLAGQVTREGLWLVSTVEPQSAERISQTISSMEPLNCSSRREEALAISGEGSQSFLTSAATRFVEGFRVVASAVGRSGNLSALPSRGDVTMTDKLARCLRPGLTEEYSVSVDGVRQDFVLMQRSDGIGALRVELDVIGAKAEALGNGARLVLAGSGRF